MMVHQVTRVQMVNHMGAIHFHPYPFFNYYRDSVIDTGENNFIELPHISKNRKL